jgi:hypothetical protein
LPLDDPGFLCPQCGLPQGDARCPHRSAVPAPTGAPAKVAPGSIDVSVKVVPEGDVTLTALGFEGCGKTTYVGMLYFLLACGKLPGYRFAWSDSLRELEQIRSQLHRPLDQGGPAFPPRTSREKTTFLHLGLRRLDDDRYVDVYFPEFSGEDVAQVWNTGQFAPNVVDFLGKMRAYVVFIDATTLGMSELGRTQLLFKSLLELKKTNWLTDPVALVLSKWDSVEEPLTPEEFVKARAGGLLEWCEGYLANFRLFGVSSVGKVRTVLGRDGRPVRKEHSDEPVTVPSPEPGEEESGPLFRYRPKNVSRPLVWILDELLAKRAEAKS